VLRDRVTGVTGQGLRGGVGGVYRTELQGVTGRELWGRLRGRRGVGKGEGTGGG
jgi:hypothetical protein